MRVLIISLSLLLWASCAHRSDDILEATDYSAEFKSNCQVKLLTQGRAALLQRIQLIRSAKKSIDLQTFIWTDDDCGRILMNEFVTAAHRGVRVRLLCDHLFSDQNASKIAAICKTPNLELKIYNPATKTLRPSTLDLMLKSLGSFHNVNQRMHNKILLVDGKEAICGGRNIEDTYYDNSTGLNFKDLDIAVRGEVTSAMTRSFEQFWASPLSISAASLKDVASKLETAALLNLHVEKIELYQLIQDSIRKDPGAWTNDFKDVEKMAFFSDLPGKNSSQSFSGGGHLNSFLIQSLKQANQRIWIQSPYLVISDRAEELFRSSRKKQPDLEIRVSTNSLAATDSWPTYAFLYKQKKMSIGELNIQLFEFNPLPKDLLEFIPNYNELLKKLNGMSSLPTHLRQSGKVTDYPRLCLHSKCMLIDDCTSRLYYVRLL